nr:hypothetical protein [Spirochaetaceae bacterium]
NRPFDIGRLGALRGLVSESQGDRVSRIGENGYREKTFGQTGRGPGDLLGPQFLALSGEYFYVSDWGNKEIDKFALSGEHILSFGEPQEDFPGFKGPSGVALTPMGLAVSDQLAGTVFLFDENGNFLKILIDRGLASPEGLTMGEDGRLLIADGNRVLAYDLELDALNLLYQSAEENSRILKVCYDENGNLAIPDFNTNIVSLQTELSTLYGGLFLRIDRVDSRAYPEVVVDVTVEDINGRPYVGLDGSNFLIKEGPQYLQDFRMLSAGYQTSELYCSLLLENSPEMEERTPQLQYSLSDLLINQQQGDRFSLWTLGENPYEMSSNAEDLMQDFKEQWQYQESSSEDSFDVAIRMAASAMLDSRKRRILLFFSTGQVAADAFDTYGLVELASYLKNNNVLFYPVYVSSSEDAQELNYLAEQTGGKIFHSLDPLGLGPIIRESRTVNQGSYTLQFRSIAPNDFGRKYIPLVLEVNYLRKSGRDELGYFAPLDYRPRN